MPNRYAGRGTGLLAMFLWLAPVSGLAEISIGMAGPLTGSVALNGEQIDLGAQRAVFDLNASGGLLGQKVTLISVDDACDVAQAKAAANRLVASNVSVVIGHLCSRTSIAASEIYAAAGTLMISPASTNPSVTDRRLPNVFRTIGRDDDQAAVAVEFLLANFADKSIALLHDGNTYGKGLAEGVRRGLRAAGKTEAVFSEFQPNKKSYAEAVDTLRSQNADIIYVVSNAVQDAALLIRQYKAVRPEAVFVSAEIMASDGFSLIAGEAAKGTYFTFGPDARFFPAAKDVVAAFRDEEAYEPTGYTLNSYAAVQAWAQAVEAAGDTDTQKVAEALRKGGFETVMGEIGFDDKGDITGMDAFIMYIWGDAQYAPVE